ncbi:hypothetical protein LS70_003175 [Helicobacter sp. MIT 11-5569]|uniref:hypothetical protein n=1 Tax=Helicobacter sp. MIT 11-5569 TaxID=1548151 RepID=UPI00051F8A62|nr:hypothetical protein [Helicobacter sp. MIT 11-5569]TLD84564.1 hypothetical protein LS70_003175 [Helicobacter sp. MIT 11-5569]
MRWILSLCFVAQLVGARDIFEALQTMQFDTKKQELLKVAMGDFYAENHAYTRNNHHIRDRMLVALAQGETNLTQYTESFEKVSKQYIAAKTEFYQEVVGILGEEQTEELIEILTK